MPLYCSPPSTATASAVAVAAAAAAVAAAAAAIAASALLRLRADRRRPESDRVKEVAGLGGEGVGKEKTEPEDSSQGGLIGSSASSLPRKLLPLTVRLTEPEP